MIFKTNWRDIKRYDGPSKLFKFQKKLKQVIGFCTGESNVLGLTYFVRDMNFADI